MNISQFNLVGKTALITGGGSGIGYGIARSYTDAGAKVIIVGRTEERLQTAVNKLGAKAHYRVFDITNQSKIKGFIEKIVETYGPLHILVNNAGIHLKAPASETTDEDFLSVIQTHLLSAFSLSREVMNNMKEYQVKGSVIMINSMTGIMAMTQVVAYTSAKTGMLGLMRGLLADYALDGIRVNSIAPGWIESKMLHKALEGDAERKNKILSRIPFKNFGKPEDIGNAAIYLGSDASAYVNGVLLPVDGGGAVGF